MLSLIKKVEILEAMVKNLGINKDDVYDIQDGGSDYYAFDKGCKCIAGISKTELSK